jgi:triosephosphate isomerase
MRQPIVAGNWKMNYGRHDEALGFVQTLRGPLDEIQTVERVLCPPFTVLHAVAALLADTSIGLGAQNMYWEQRGAHTGDISPTMLAETCQYVILGHSERRAAASPEDSDMGINRKIRAALAHNLTPILCVGENLEQNEAGETNAFVGGQIEAALQGLSAEQVRRCVIAYEPIWAIGTGKAATPEDANHTIAEAIRREIAQIYGDPTSEAVRVQYGGSVNPENIAAFMAMPDIDGALVGGASLKPDFVELVRSAALG